MGMTRDSAGFAKVAPFFEGFEPLGEAVKTSRFTHLEALMDVEVEGELCRLWSATVVSVEEDERLLACALVMGPRFPQDKEPPALDLTRSDIEGAEGENVPRQWQSYAVQGSLFGWAGLLPSTPNDDMHITK